MACADDRRMKLVVKCCASKVYQTNVNIAKNVFLRRSFRLSVIATVSSEGNDKAKLTDLPVSRECNNRCAPVICFPVLDPYGSNSENGRLLSQNRNIAVRLYA